MTAPLMSHPFTYERKVGTMSRPWHGAAVCLPQFLPTLPQCSQDARFDVITCQYGLQFTPDITAAMRAAARVLHPGGLYVAAVTAAESQMDQVWGRPLLDAA